MKNGKKCRVYGKSGEFIEIPVKISHSSNDKETLNHIFVIVIASAILDDNAIKVALNLPLSLSP